MPQTDQWTILQLLNWTTDYLKKHGVENPRLDAEVLLAEARGCQRIDLYARYNESPEEAVRTAYREMIRRRVEGTPVAYLVGKKEFYSHSFHVNYDVLIPRPETEDLVTLLLDGIKEWRQSRPESKSEQEVEIADIGAGSGILGICAALHASPCRIVAVDIIPAALEVARKNAQDHGVADCMEFVHGDLFTDVAQDLTKEGLFDFVVSNPPYVSQQEYESLPTEVKDQEPQAALLAGPTGVEVISRLAGQAADRLRGGGWLMMEISPMIEKAAVESILKTEKFESPAAVRVNQLPRIVKARRKN